VREGREADHRPLALPWSSHGELNSSKSRVIQLRLVMRRDQAAVLQWAHWWSVGLVGPGPLGLLVEFGFGGRRQLRLGCPRAGIAFVAGTTAFVARLAFVECVASVVAAAVDGVVPPVGFRGVSLGQLQLGWLASFGQLVPGPLLVLVAGACPGSPTLPPFAPD